MVSQWICLACVMASCLAGAACAAGSRADGPLRVPVTVHNFSAQRMPQVPVCTGIPLPKSAVADPAALRLLDRAGKPVPAQFDVQARWADGSVKWVLVSFFAEPEAAESLEFLLTDEASVAKAAPDRPVRVIDDTNDCLIKTGPLRFRINKHGFGGISQAWLDVTGNGKFEPDELITPETDASGIVAVDRLGTIYTSKRGRVTGVDLERTGPVHATIAIRGDLRSDSSSEPLLQYVMRIHAFAGSSLLRKASIS